jgi:hypothetical protein
MYIHQYTVSKYSPEERPTTRRARRSISTEPACRELTNKMAAKTPRMLFIITAPFLLKRAQMGNSCPVVLN